MVLNKLLKDKWSFYSLAIIGLSFSHLVTAYTWINWEIWSSFSSNDFRASCYDFWPRCTSFSLVNVFPIKVFIYLYFIIALIIFIPIFLQKNRAIKILFLLLFLIKTILFFSRYNYMGNYHTMHLCLSLVFLVSTWDSVPYRFALILQYFWAGFLKTNLEWMSGAALTKDPLFFSDSIHLLSLGYVVVLEVFLVWGLLAKQVFIRRLTLIQLLLFHSYSYFIVGYLYPLIMIGILFPLIGEDFFEKKSLSYSKREIKYIPVLIVVTMICLINISVKFSTVDPAKDGRVRHFSLNMLDARNVCNYKLYEIFHDNDVRSLNIPKLDDSLRVRCDPLVFESYLRHLCREKSMKKINSTLYFHLETRRFTEKKYTTIREYKDVCQEI